jgi:hypothetical protein
MTEAGLLEGHEACASFLENTVEELLLHSANLDISAKQTLLAEVVSVFTMETSDSTY